MVKGDLFVWLFLSLAISHQAYTYTPVNDLSTAVKLTNQLLHFWGDEGGGGGGGLFTTTNIIVCNCTGWDEK